MIHRPSRVACKPFGAGPGELKTVSTLPILRVRIRKGSKREAAITVVAVAAVNVINSLRFMAAPLQASYIRPRRYTECSRSGAWRSSTWSRRDHNLRCSLRYSSSIEPAIRDGVFYFAATTPPTVDDPVPLHPLPP